VRQAATLQLASLLSLSFNLMNIFGLFRMSWHKQSEVFDRSASSLLKDAMYLASCLSLLLFSLPLSALSVGPMIGELGTSGATARATINVVNTGKSKVSVDVTTLQIMEFNADHSEVLVDAEDEILAFPPAFQLDPGASQTVQVQYVGDPEIDVSHTYRVVVESLPIVDPSSTDVRVGTKMSTLYSVVPQAVSSNIRVLNISKEGEQGDLWKVTVENSGDKFVRLSTTKWTMEAEGTSVVLDPKSVEKVVQNNMVLPRSTRIVGALASDKIPFTEDLEIRIEETSN